MPHGRGLAAPESGVFVCLILSLASANIVTLTSSKVLPFEKAQILFGFLLTYSYLSPLVKVGCTSEKLKKNLLFHSVCTTFAGKLQNDEKSINRRTYAYGSIRSCL